MKLLFITLTAACLLLTTSSCKKRVAEQPKIDTELIEDEDIDLDFEDEDIFAEDLTSDTTKQVNEEPASVEQVNGENSTENVTENTPPKKVTSNNVTTVNPAEVGKLMRYNVVISTLSKQDGVNRLSKTLDKEGIKYFVVKSNGLFMFVVGSSDSEEAAIKARKDFLLKTTVDKSRQQIWKDYEIEITDTYILERR